MTAIAAILSRPIRRLSRMSVWALAFALLVAVAGAGVFARALTLRDSVLPGVRVAGVDLGGLSRAEARARIERELAPRLAVPVTLSVGEKRFRAQPANLWALDAAATAERAFAAGRESIVSRLRALAPIALELDTEPVLLPQPPGLRRLEQRLQRVTERPVNAGVRMDGLEPVVSPGDSGTAVDAQALVGALAATAFAGGGRLAAEVVSVPPAITTAEAEAAAAQVRTLTAAAVGIRFAGRRVGELDPRALARLIRFQRAGGSLEVTLDQDALAKALSPMVKAKTTAPVNARFDVVGTRVRVLRSRAGTTVAPVKAREAVLTAALEPGAREARVTLTKLPADFTTRDAKALGIREQVSTFTTDMGESSPNRIWNVHLLGRYLDGTIIKPGQWFGYNKEVGPRTVERGFREGQMIFGGVLIPSIGGGVCQTATTVFNAAFEAGLPIKERHNHSFYISHYPTGRDATVSWGGPDLVFRNDLDNAILIKVTYTDTTFTVTFYGTKQGRRVVASTSTPTNYTQPRLQYAVDPSAPPGSVRYTGGGGPGFDVNVHRKVYERGKLIRENDFFTRYVPENPTAIYGPGQTPPGDFFYLPSF